ncbi:MAG: hypothetical protein ACYC7A_14230 [Thermoanaerobaculia bacterium]
MKTAIRLLVPSFLFSVSLAACASSPAPSRDFAPRSMMQSRSATAEFSLPSIWWRDPVLSEPLQLAPEQLRQLDALQPEEQETARLERDSMVAARELREALNATEASAETIIAAGAHLREIRGLLLERQIAGLAAQREILTPVQWNTLQRQIAAQARRGNGMERRPGGRGEMRPGGGMGEGMSGRRPGF